MILFCRNLITLKIILLFCVTICSAQDKAQDSIAVDTSEIEVHVIRWEQKKIKNILRGVKLRSPKYSFNATKPLTKKPKKFIPTSFWDNKNDFGININEVAFVNWNAGGDNSISALGNLNFVRNYKFRYINWDNELRFRYGINAQEGRKLRKTDDFIRLSSTFGFRKDTITNWYYSVKMNFNTQFSNGFKYPDRTTPISRFMAPGYLFLGAGTSYIPEAKKFNLYISPFTQKATFVLDDRLSQLGAFGVDAGKNVFMEIGFLVTNTWEEEVFKNISLNHRISLYTDYLRSFGNIDLDWELAFTFTVNENVKANIGTHFIYDDDIKFDEVVADDGTVIDPGEPRIQFKQFLGVGFNYSF
ncbi:DUF3078 domain-containing protein [Croceitalea sp. MTPC9]|uniref:DUF3078 domain-containing protein n=1 Tax=unclassified Croceitalea TaxID=2632280 RepID=UPI002B3FD589|nr:DUF3078 domain-containing protein [Croceitalea sp. MTPC6]GMN16402.1 DUF3078 domain-containing protein [Croceitalea sp. MTPC9]